jgi:hypothetical protein
VQLGTSALKEGAVVTVEKKHRKKKRKNRATRQKVKPITDVASTTLDR